MKLATIGYEGATLADFVATLVAANIKRVVDVREIAQSRRPGFSKNSLRTALVEVGIDYHHVRQLGDPKPGREAARAGKLDLFRSIFYAHLDLPASQEALNAAILLAKEMKSVLVCFERDPSHCHRAIVADRIAALSSLRIENLGVRARKTQGAQDNVKPADRLFGAH